MPYVPSLKTQPPQEDREILDPLIDDLAKYVAVRVISNFSLISKYVTVFEDIINVLKGSVLSKKTIRSPTMPAKELAIAIFEVAEKYEYEGAFLGELNYAITRLIQRVPQMKVQRNEWKEELRYWLYAATVEALLFAKDYASQFEIGIAGVFEDIKDEYKWRVNRAYEAAQIIKSGDCYDTPYYTRLVSVFDENGKHVGYMDIYLKRSEETLHKDVLEEKLILNVSKLIYNMNK